MHREVAVPVITLGQMEDEALVKPRDLPNPSGQIDGLSAAITDWRGKGDKEVKRFVYMFFASSF